jgi:formate hydrogenlyase subunit 4
VLAALDTGSSFEGMGASREISFAALAEPAFYLVMAIFCLPAHSLSFSGIFAALPWEEWGFMHPEYLVAAAALFLVMLAENSRIPVDDPNTHLELTMIHEVMILDHSGPDLAAILYGSAIKLFLFAALITHILLPVPNTVWGLPIFLLGIVLVGLCIGVVESGMGRLSLKRVPQLLVGASVLALVALGVLFFRGLA